MQLIHRRPLRLGIAPVIAGCGDNARMTHQLLHRGDVGASVLQGWCSMDVRNKSCSYVPVAGRARLRVSRLCWYPARWASSKNDHQPIRGIETIIIIGESLQILRRMPINPQEGLKQQKSQGVDPGFLLSRSRHW